MRQEEAIERVADNLRKWEGKEILMYAAHGVPPLRVRLMAVEKDGLEVRAGHWGAPALVP